MGQCQQLNVEMQIHHKHTSPKVIHLRYVMQFQKHEHILIWIITFKDVELASGNTIERQFMVLGKKLGNQARFKSQIACN